MQKTRNYIIVIAVLLGANFLLFFSVDFSAAKTEGQNYFRTSELARLSKVQFTYDTVEVSMTKAGDGWQLNGRHKVDDGFFNTLISVLERVEEGRKLNSWDGEILGRVELLFEQGKSVQFEFTSNPTQTKSYFISEERVVEVAVPGYRDNVASIFLLHPDQWRDRMVVDGSWRTIQRLELKSFEGQNLDITFEDQFFLVNGGAPIDSTGVIDYLNQFQYFQANEMISKGRFPALDSLSKREPMATLVIDDIKGDMPTNLFIYPRLEGQRYHLVTKDSGEMMVIDAQRISAILNSPLGTSVQ